MKSAILFVFLAFMATTAFGKSHWEKHAPDGEPRLCPDGYTYVGDDKTNKTSKNYWMEEDSRTPVYSCYKMIKEASNYLEASEKCQDDEGQLLSLQDEFEALRLQYHYFEEGYFYQNNDDNNCDDSHEDSSEESHEDKKAPKSEAILTSGLFLQNQWVWFGANATFNMTFEGMDNETMNLDCLLVTMGKNQTTTFIRTSCYDKSQYMCEVRVQTVTYFAWFMANWFSVLLVFLVIVLLLSLCITGTMYSRRPRYAGRVYRASEQPAFDTPPSYNRATGNTPMNRYMNKGRELVSKVYTGRSNNEKSMNPM